MDGWMYLWQTVEQVKVMSAKHLLLYDTEMRGRQPHRVYDWHFNILSYSEDFPIWILLNGQQKARI